MLPASSTPWKPATTAIAPCLFTSVMREPSMVRMRALVNALSVSTRTW